jgi:hypothetical protein
MIELIKIHARVRTARMLIFVGLGTGAQEQGPAAAPSRHIGRRGKSSAIPFG